MRRGPQQAGIALRTLWPIPVLVLGALASGCVQIRDGLAPIVPFYSIPRDQGFELSTKPVEPFESFPRLHDGLKPTFDQIEQAVEGELLSFGSHAPPGPGHRLVAEFLAISDLQLRDEKVYAEGKSSYVSKLVYFDRFAGSAIRPAFVERFDTLTLASFLIAYRKEIEPGAGARAGVGPSRTHRHTGDPFVLHIGDLLDISASSELLAGLTTTRLCLSGDGAPPAYMVAGNHDGLVFGVVENRQADMKMLGVNLSEFVLGHLLLDPGRSPDGHARGYGFGGNELVRRFHKGSAGLEFLTTRQWARATGMVPRQGVRGMTAHRGRLLLILGPEAIDSEPAYEWGWRGQAARQARYLIAAAGARARRRATARADEQPAASEAPGHPPRLPLVLSNDIDVDDRADGGELQLGYYHWDKPLEPPLGEVRGIRYIVLDTRKPGTHQGGIGLVQLGWLYNRLADAVARRYAVVIIAHHSPSDLAKPGWALGAVEVPTTRVFHRMLSRFPNIVAYFYGHTHWNDHEPWPGRRGRFHIIQTGSLADFPQVGRKVWIYLDQAGEGAYTARIASEFVRPRGTATEVGEMLDSLLAASLNESLKEFNESVRTYQSTFARLSGGCGILRRVPARLRPVKAGWQEWSRANLDSDEIDVPFGFQVAERRGLGTRLRAIGGGKAGPLDASVFFGHRLGRANRMRAYLGLPRIVSAPTAIEPVPAPQFSEPSGVAVLRTPRGEPVAIVADDETGHALYGAELPDGGKGASGALRLRWREMALKGETLGDMEALAPWGSRQVFAVCSQSRTRDHALLRPSRSRLALVTFSEDIGAVEGVQVFEGFRGALARHLEVSLRGVPLVHGLAAIADKRPSAGGLNVEALAAWHGTLFLGLRGPITSEGHAIVVPLLNPDAMIERRAAPQFGPPLVLETGAAGTGFHLVEWTPPDPAALAGRDATAPVVIGRGALRVTALAASSLAGLGEHAVPEGIAALEGRSEADDRLLVVQDPEAFRLDDAFVTIVRAARLTARRK